MSLEPADEGLRDILLAAARNEMEGRRGLGQWLLAHAPGIDGEIDPAAVALAVWERIAGSKRRVLDKLAQAVGSEPRLVRSAAVRGCSTAEVEEALRRPLDPAELDAWRPLADDLAAKGYLIQALRNELRSEIRRRTRPERPFGEDGVDLIDTPVDPLEASAAAAALALFERLLDEFAVAHPTERRWLQELESSSRSAAAWVQEQTPGLDDDALQAVVLTKQQHWSRARARLRSFVEGVRLGQGERLLVDRVMELIDDRFRRRRRPPPRRSPPREENP